MRGNIRKALWNVLTQSTIIFLKTNRVIRGLKQDFPLPSNLANALICDCLLFGDFTGSCQYGHVGTCHSRQSESVSLMFAWNKISLVPFGECGDAL